MTEAFGKTQNFPRTLTAFKLWVTRHPSSTVIVWQVQTLVAIQKQTPALEREKGASTSYLVAKQWQTEVLLSFSATSESWLENFTLEGRGLKILGVAKQSSGTGKFAIHLSHFCIYCCSPVHAS